MNTIDDSKEAGSFFAKIEKLSKIQRILVFTSVFVLIIVSQSSKKSLTHWTKSS
jgi:hypothetical protein